jgi:NAD(P)-dependent dehydrogenase (short-subunit alcohol dehydrogenase family)
MAKTHHVIVADRDGDGAGAVTSEIVAAGGTATPIAVDVSDGASVRAMKAQIETDIGPRAVGLFRRRNIHPGRYR